MIGKQAKMIGKEKVCQNHCHYNSVFGWQRSGSLQLSSACGAYWWHQWRLGQKSPRNEPRTRSIQNTREKARRTSKTPRNIGSYKQKAREKSPRTRWFFKFSLSFLFVVHFHVYHWSWWLNRSDFSLILLIYHFCTLLVGLTSGWLSYQSIMSKPEQKSRDIKEVSAIPTLDAHHLWSTSSILTVSYHNKDRSIGHFMSIF